MEDLIYMTFHEYAQLSKNGVMHMSISCLHDWNHVSLLC